MWKFVLVIMLGLVGWVGLALSTPGPDPSPTPIWIDMTPTHAFFQSTTTTEMVNEILTRASYWSGPNWQEPKIQAVYEAHYTTSETPEQVLTAFFNAFTTGDWQHLSDETLESRSGFTEAVPFTTHFCYLRGHGTLRLSIEDPADEMTDVSIYVNFPSREYTCGDTAAASGIDLPSLKDLPLLAAPQGVVIVSYAQSDVANGVIYDAYEDGLLFRSTRPLADIVADYHAQLTAQGWHVVLEEVTSSEAMSIWTLVDDEGSVWTGMMVFTSDAEPDHYRAYIAMEPRP